MLTKEQIEAARAELKAEIDTNQQCIDDLRAEPVIDEDEEEDEIGERELVSQRLWHAFEALEAYERAVALVKEWVRSDDPQTMHCANDLMDALDYK